MITCSSICGLIKMLLPSVLGFGDLDQQQRQCLGQRRQAQQICIIYHTPKAPVGCHCVSENATATPLLLRMTAERPLQCRQRFHLQTFGTARLACSIWQHSGGWDTGRPSKDMQVNSLEAYNVEDCNAFVLN